MTRRPDPAEAAALEAQEARIETAARDFLEDLLAGKASVEFRPLEADGSIAANVGGEKGVSVLSGFAIRLVPGR
jgi:hypothetical protein